MATHQDTQYFLPWFSNDKKARGDQFEKLMCWWLKNDSIIKASYNFEKVIRYIDWADRPNIDLGTDLVAWDLNGKIYAIQCKSYKLSTLIRKNEVSQLVADADRETFYKKIFITSSSGFTNNARTIALKNDVHLLSNEHLIYTNLVWPKSESELIKLINETTSTNQILKKPNKLYQIEAIDKVVEHFKHNNKAQLIMACGSGKTLTSLWIKENMFKKNSNKKTVLLFPSLSLLSNTLKEWACNRNFEWEFIAVCSDQSVTKSNDDTYEDLKSVDAGFPVTTDVSEVRKFLRNCNKEQIIFATYQSSHVVSEAALAEKLTFDLVIADEAHRLAGQAGLNYSLVLNDDKFPAKKKLFMTATPRYASNYIKKLDFDGSIKFASMDDGDKFGKVAYKLSFNKAIELGILTDYQVVISFTDSEEASNLIKDNNFIDLYDKPVTISDFAKTVAVLKAAKLYGIKRAISFHSSIKRSKDFLKIVENVNKIITLDTIKNINLDHVDGMMSALDRLNKLKILESGSKELNILANAKCLTEGINVPALDAVVFADPRQSEIDIVQAVGRAIRKSDNKKIGTIIIPIVTSKKDLVEEKIDNEGYKKIRQILYALKAHDEDLSFEIENLLRKGVKSTIGLSGLQLPDKIKIVYGNIDLERFSDQINAIIYQASSENYYWNQSYNSILLYYKDNNKWPSRSDEDAKTKKLWHWVVNQRTGRKRFNANKPTGITAEKIEILDNTPGWKWAVDKDLKWDRQYNDCVAYYKNNDKWPSAESKDANIRKLGFWVKTQRTEQKRFKDNVLSAMTKERFEILDKTVGWDWTEDKDLKWDLKYKDCVSYFKNNNKWPSSEHKDDKIKKLGVWIVNQRTGRKRFNANKPTGITAERIEILDKTAGWKWAEDYDLKWDRQYNDCVSYFNNNNIWPSYKDKDATIAKLGRWVTTQRTEQKRFKDNVLSAMTKERFEILDKTVGWDWENSLDDFYS
jgi:predicted helicase